MQPYAQPITELIRKRFSCRTYAKKPISPDKLERMQAFLGKLPDTPFDSQPRFKMVATAESDTKTLRGLGTYGFIKNPSAFVIGATHPSPFDLEDFGYLMETIILHATSLELGTCWLGGTFTKSRFAKKMNLSPTEIIPAVISEGECDGMERQGWASRKAGSHRRLPWENLFFDQKFDIPLLRSKAAEYATALEMVRIGPSASNKQPWRIVRGDGVWRFYLRRTPGYFEDPIKRILGLCDLQRLDMGIAMCHFELTARELGLDGNWVVEKGIDIFPEELTEYVASWERNAE
jgi:nitroreductase